MKKLITIISLFLAQNSLAAIEAAQVNGEVITVEQVNARISDQARGGNPNSPNKKAALEDLMKRAAAIQAAKKAGLDKDPVIAERINNVLYYALLEKEVGTDFSKLTLSDAEARRYYSKNPEIRTSHIFIALPPSASEADEKSAIDKLKSVEKQISSGQMSFAEAAQKHSEDPSSAIGGDLDYRMKDRLDPAYYSAALSIRKIGDISGPIRTPFGVHLVRLTGKHSWNETNRTQVKRIYLEEKRAQLTDSFLDSLLKKAKVKVNNSALN